MIVHPSRPTLHKDYYNNWEDDSTTLAGQRYTKIITTTGKMIVHPSRPMLHQDYYNNWEDDSTP